MNEDYDSIGMWIARRGCAAILGGALLTAPWACYQKIGNNINYSNGVRSGMINKISNKGLFWKTWEGEMALEGMVSGENSNGANVWDFSIDRDDPKTQDLVKKIQTALSTGQKVKVDYTQKLTTWPWRSDTTYLITDVQPIEKLAEK